MIYINNYQITKFNLHLCDIIFIKLYNKEQKYKYKYYYYIYKIYIFSEKFTKMIQFIYFLCLFALINAKIFFFSLAAELFSIN